MSEEGLLEYRVLDPPGKAIRILTLLPGEFSDAVYLSIAHEELQDEKRTPYESLSYTWGSEDQAREKLYIWQTTSGNGSDVNVLQFLYVRTNLLTALKYLRLPNATRVLWIDAICIDQQNLGEKGREVARMGQIYNKAEQVLVWLGQEDESTPMVLETIERLSAGIIMEQHHRSCKIIPGSEAEVVKYRSEESTLTPQHWISLSKLIKRSWFQRLWIRQEVQLASKVLVRCGYSEIKWEDVEKVVVFIEHAVSKTYISMNDILFCRSLFPYLGSDSLAYTLHRSSLCGYFDARDLVYANLSTSSAMKELQIKPDYTLTVADVFKDLTCKYIQHFTNLELFRMCDLQSLPQGFKSFIPDFSVPKSESRLSSVYAHAGSRQSFVDIKGENMGLKGRIVDKVQNVSKFRKPLATSSVNGDNYMDIIKTYHQWEPEALKTSKYPIGGTLLDAFTMLLSNGFCKETYGLGHLPTIEESRNSFLAAVWSGGDPELIRDPSFKCYLGELMSDRRGEIFFQTTEGYIGTSPADVQAGDIISVLVGGSVPFVLRPSAHQPGSHQIVGPCYLQGVMFGEALLGPLPEEWLCIIRKNRKWCFQERGSGKKTWEDPRLQPLASPWQIHFCNFANEAGLCGGTCEEKCDETGQLIDRYFFNTQLKEKSKNDPRLDVEGLEAGGIGLHSFTLV